MHFHILLLLPCSYLHLFPSFLLFIKKHKNVHKSIHFHFLSQISVKWETFLLKNVAQVNLKWIAVRQTLSINEKWWDAYIMTNPALLLAALVISSRTKLEILIPCPPALLGISTSSFPTSTHDDASLSFLHFIIIIQLLLVLILFLHSFMDGCSSLWLLLLIDVCWHHKKRGITTLLWHSMMHYWLLRYFLSEVLLVFLSSHFIALQTLFKSFTHSDTHFMTESFNINLVCDLFLLISIHSLIQFS